MKCNFFNKHKWIFRSIVTLPNQDETDSIKIPTIRFCSKCGLIQKNLYTGCYYTDTHSFSITNRWFSIGIKSEKNDANHAIPETEKRNN